MRYIRDNDLHIHSKLSLCSKDPEQTPERILEYAKENGLKTIVLTDHCWDEKTIPSTDWYKYQDLEYVCRSKPLPQTEGVEFLFGVETELNKDMVLGIRKESFDALDFIVISTTHFHMKGFTISLEDAASPEGRAKVWISRLEGLLNMELPFKKIGIAHLACSLIAPTREEYLKVLELLPEDKMAELFKKAAEVGVGIELNCDDMNFADDEAELVLRPFKIAKAQGCKFYMGSDAHHPSEFEGCRHNFERAIDMLGLTEDDKFHIAR